jgi:hypothetical protein
MSLKSTMPDSFEQELLTLYFQHGSIEQVFHIKNYDLPVSFATYHRLLNRFGIIKSAGPNSRLSESLNILSLINNYKVPLERVYRKYAPSSLKVSTNTLHRIMHHIRLGVTRRCGTALVISNQSFPDRYLIAQDNSLHQPSLGQSGDFSLPMGHTRMQDSHITSVTRVLQQEVFTNPCIQGDFPFSLIPKDIAPIFFINVADIKVAVYRLIIPDKYHLFSSLKLHNYHFVSQTELQSFKLRPGVTEIIEKHEELRYLPQTQTEIVIDSNLNLALSRLPSRLR